MLEQSDIISPAPLNHDPSRAAADTEIGSPFTITRDLLSFRDFHTTMLAGQQFRLIALVCTALVAVLLGFVFVPPFAALEFVQHSGYFVILTAFVWFCVALLRLARRSPLPFSWSMTDTRFAVASMCIAIFWQVHGPHGFKVLMDEYVLSVTAMNMHFEREIFVPLKTHDINGVYATLGGVLDKRPVFFPFLLSLVHDLTGYRAANVFVLNGVLSALLLFLAARISSCVGRSEMAGLFSIALLAGLPLLAGNATGAGFEILNLCMLCATIVLGIRWLRTPDSGSLDAFVLCGVLLAQTRYESSMFVLAVGGVVLWGWFRGRRIIVSWGVVAAPALLILIPFQNKVFELNKGYWQLENTTGGPFQFGFFTGNLGHAVEFLFVVDGVQLGSPVLSVVGIVSAVCLLVYVARRVGRLGGEPETGVMVAFGVCILANFLLLLCYHWGQIDDYMASRLALPLLLLFSLAAAFVAGRMVKNRRGWTVLLGLAALWMFFAGIPISARAEAVNAFLSFRETSWQREFVLERKGTGSLFILPSPLPAVIERQPAISVAVFNERADEMAYHFEQKTYRDVFVFQRLEIDPATGVTHASELSALGPEFVLETIEERRFRPLYLMRLSRLAGVDLSRRPPRSPDWRPNFPPFELQATEENPTPGGIYMRNFLEKLP